MNQPVILNLKDDVPIRTRAAGFETQLGVVAHQRPAFVAKARNYVEPSSASSQ